MKILATADLHGNIKLYKELATLANKTDCDAVVICGDMLPKSFVLTFEDLIEAQYDSEYKIDDVLGTIKCPVIYISGNDDLAEVKLNNGVCIDEKKISICGVTFTGFPYVHTTPFNTNKECDEQQLMNLISSQYEKLKIEDAKPLVFVAHGPIKDHRDKVYRGGYHVGSESIAKFVEEKKPLVYLCGHIHEDFGYSKAGDTHIFNCASRHDIDMLRGYMIDIEDGQVSWKSI